MKYCKRCGLITKEDMLLCPSCGNKLIDYIPPTKNKWLIPVCVVTLVVVLALAGLLISSVFSNREADSTMAKLRRAIEIYIQNEIFEDEELPVMLEYHNAILEEVTFDIQSYDLKKGTMDVEFTYINVLALADSFTDSNISEEEYYTDCIEKIGVDEYEPVTEVISVSFEAGGDHYVVITTDPLTNVLTGGILNYYIDLLEDADHE